ncbi:sensor domain-containing diguanylate cyclase [Roseomonas sp. USHLN139]|uniref:sensor domain-containing diguanylate cyclase n=1 Tax=Roseomonas sp. USHLN139 TaxID=3081298 RepID=UPI003B018F81
MPFAPLPASWPAPWSPPWPPPSPAGIEEDDGLQALAGFVRQAAGADLVVAYEAGEDGLATPRAADPGPPPGAFCTAGLRLEAHDFSGGPLPACSFRLPSGVLAALGRPAARVYHLATPVPGAPRSGVLMLYAAPPARPFDGPFRSAVGQGLPLLGKAFCQMLGARRAVLQRCLLSERFHDLFESVQSGIAILDGDGSTALVNQAAARLLDLPSGELSAARLAAAMRRLRESAGNAAALAAAYAPRQADLDYAMVTHWLIGDRQLEVDTHPILGNGRRGRIWLFVDVTAQRRAQEELRRMAGTDPLTGLPNRRHFTAAGRALVERMQAAGQPLGLLMLDIDHFKSINDRHGHPIGDLVLQAVARRCRSLLRGPHDLIARLGGEEFAVLLPQAGPAETAAVAERLRASMAARPVLSPGGDVAVHLSIGAVVRVADETLEAVLQRSDRALYSAKQAGRNRVACG